MALDFVNVNVRIKPPPKRKSFKSAFRVISTNPAVLLSVEKQVTFNFDNIFSEESSQEDVYNKTVEALVQKVKEGYNCTIFAYGQTGTGKTYTMGTNPEEENTGIISRALEDFFSDENEQICYDVHVSFMEIYNEKCFDLLKNDKVPLSVKGMRTEGLSIEKVFNIYEAKHFLELGGRNRHTGETKQNLFSSRSHAIFSIYFTVDHGHKKTSAKLNLVDLAGSESVKKTGTQGNSFQEGININKGLLCIGQVMTALSANLTYVPYRQSIITTILQDSLNKNNYISLIACVKSDSKDHNESIQTLDFAQRLKRMKTKPEVNEVLTKFKAENPELFEKNYRISSTPMKRSVNTPFKHPFKKPRGLSVLSNLSVPPSGVLDNSKSVALSSSAANSEVGLNFSPVIRKYMSQLECTIIDKLQTVIQNTLKRRTRSNAEFVSGNEENTPKYSWSQIQHKVSKLVQEEVVQLTTKTSRVTSSPLDHVDLEKAKKILMYNISPLLKEEMINRSFKELSRRNMFTKSTPCISPINSSSPRNVDTIFKKPTLPDDRNMEKSLISCYENVAPRRSTRLSLRQTTRFEKSFIPAVINPVRKSRRLTNINICTCECEHRMLTKSKKTISKEKESDNPKRNRVSEVLDILNRGDKKQLQKLSSIGPKTAERILLFRHIKGSFHSINDLAEMPGWSSTIFQNFVNQNFLEI